MFSNFWKIQLQHYSELTDRPIFPLTGVETVIYGLYAYRNLQILTPAFRVPLFHLAGGRVTTADGLYGPQLHVSDNHSPSHAVTSLGSESQMGKRLSLSVQPCAGG